MKKRERTPKTYARITHPMVRDEKGGPFRRATWDEALDLIAERLHAVAAEHGAEAILPYKGW